MRLRHRAVGFTPCGCPPPVGARSTEQPGHCPLQHLLLLPHWQVPHWQVFCSMQNRQPAGLLQLSLLLPHWQVVCFRMQKWLFASLTVRCLLLASRQPAGLLSLLQLLLLLPLWQVFRLLSQQRFWAVQAH